MPDDARLANQSAPVGVISAHLDDAVLSCSAAFSEGSVVVTVFASGPSRVDPLSKWDAASGLFSPGDDVFAARVAEDDAALASLGASGHRLRFWDLQYRDGGRAPSSRLARIAGRLRKTSNTDVPALVAPVLAEIDALVSTAGLTTWFAPLGICHPDHRILGQILPALVRGRPEVRWHVYDDLPYALEAPHERRAAHDRLEREGFQVQPINVTVDRERKRTAVNCYRSQLTPLAGRVQTAVDATERFYRLVDLPD